MKKPRPRKRLTAADEIAKDNIDWKCDAHAPKPEKVWGRMAPAWFIGKCVKKGFSGVDPRTGKESLEHMWVQIFKADGQVLVGRLANAPLFQMPLKPGDWLRVEIPEIEDVLDPKEIKP